MAQHLQFATWRYWHIFYCISLVAFGGQKRGKSLLDFELVQTGWFVDDWLRQTHTECGLKPFAQDAKSESQDLCV